MAGLSSIRRGVEHGGYEVELISPFTQEMPGVLKKAVVGYLQGEIRVQVQIVPKKRKR